MPSPLNICKIQSRHFANHVCKLHMYLYRCYQHHLLESRSHSCTSSRALFKAVATLPSNAAMAGPKTPFHQSPSPHGAKVFEDVSNIPRHAAKTGRSWRFLWSFEPTTGKTWQNIAKPVESWWIDSFSAYLGGNRWGKIMQIWHLRARYTACIRARGSRHHLKWNGKCEALGCTNPIGAVLSTRPICFLLPFASLCMISPANSFAPALLLRSTLLTCQPQR